MLPFRNMPINQKLMWIIMGITSAALLFSGIGVIAADSYLFRRSMERDISALAEIVSDNSTAAMSFDDVRVASETLGSLKARPHLIAACLYRSENSLFASYLKPGASASCPAGGGPDQLRFSNSGLAIRRGVYLNGERIGSLAMVSDLGEFSESMKVYGGAVLAVLVVSSLFALLLSSSLRAIIAGPISHLAQASRSISETRDYSIRVSKLHNDELGALADDFNGMLARIQNQDSELRNALIAQQAALEETQKIRDSLRTTLSSIGDAVISTDIAGRVTFANDVARGLLRVGEGEIEGRRLDEVFRIVNEYSRQPVESPVAKVLREGRIEGLSNHTILIAADGAEIPIDNSGAPIRDASGQMQGTVLVFRDVTPRRKADETSRLLASIVESTDDAIFSNDLQGIVTSWNAGAERMFGYSATEMIGRSIADITPADRLTEPAGVLERILRGEQVEHHQTLRRTAGGAMLRVSETVSPMMDPLGRVTGASTISRDITEQVRAADRLARLNDDLRRSNETLALTNQDLERFAFIASHDLQEPLRMITAYSQLLIKSYRGQFDEDATMFVRTIVDGTKRMRELLADLLAYTEIRGRDDEVLETVDLNEVLDNVSENLRTAIDEAGAQIIVGRLPALRGRPGHFQSLFQNLISNAIKYRGESPPVIQVAVQQEDGLLRFSVADNGIGIDLEYHKQIFEVFRRLHGKKISGTGVGLAICQRVVERYGGKIWVESQAGKGATFLFALPMGMSYAAGENR